MIHPIFGASYMWETSMQTFFVRWVSLIGGPWQTKPINQRWFQLRASFIVAAVLPLMMRLAGCIATAEDCHHICPTPLYLGFRCCVYCWSCHFSIQLFPSSMRSFAQSPSKEGLSVSPLYPLCCIDPAAVELVDDPAHFSPAQNRPLR